MRTIALIVLLTGCGGASPEVASAATPPPAPMSEADTKTATTPAPGLSSTNAKTAPADGKNATVSADAPDALVMYTGDVLVGVDAAKIGDTLDRIVDIAESAGGHLGARKDQSVMIRVPSSHFRDTLTKVGALGDVQHESVTAEDVSEEYHDAEVRLANLRATQKRLQDFLAKSGNLNDMLSLEHELERVSMDIDRIEGRMRYLREHAAFSTLTVSLVARATNATVAGPSRTVAAPRVMHLQAQWLDDLGVSNLLGS